MLVGIRKYRIYKIVNAKLDELMIKFNTLHGFIHFGYQEQNIQASPFIVPVEIKQITKYLKRQYLYQLLCVLNGKKSVDAYLSNKNIIGLVEEILSNYAAEDSQDELNRHIFNDFIFPLVITQDLIAGIIHEYIRVRGDRDEYNANLNGISLDAPFVEGVGWPFPLHANPYANEIIQKRKEINKRKNALQEGNPSLEYYKEIVSLNNSSISVYKAAKIVASKNNIDFAKLYKNCLEWIETNNITVIKHDKSKKSNSS